MKVEHIGYHQSFSAREGLPKISKLSFVVALHAVAIITLMHQNALRETPAKQQSIQSEVPVFLITPRKSHPVPMPRKSRLPVTHPASRSSQMILRHEDHVHARVSKDEKTQPPTIPNLSEEANTSSAPVLQGNEQTDKVSAMIDSAVKTAGKIDRELRTRQGSNAQHWGLSKMNQLGISIENSYIDRSTHERRQVFETPEGLVYYRITKHGKSTCTMSGPAGPPAPIKCPDSAAGWKTY